MKSLRLAIGAVVVLLVLALSEKFDSSVQKATNGEAAAVLQGKCFDCVERAYKALEIMKSEKTSLEQAIKARDEFYSAQKQSGIPVFVYDVTEEEIDRMVNVAGRRTTVIDGK